MNKVFYLSLMACIGISAGSLKAEESVQLENLWDAVLEKNVDVKSAENGVLAANLKRKYYSSLYAPSISVNGSNTFAPNPQRKDGTLTDMSSFSLVYGQPFTGGLNLSTAVAYSLTRPRILDDTYAVQSPSLKIGLSQGLNPWWIQGLRKTPDLSLLENEVRYQDIQLGKNIKSTLVALTRDFISLRKTERAVALLENSIALRGETLTSFTRLFEQGALSMTKIWDEKQLLIDDENTLLQNLSERDRLKEQLRMSCGTAPENASKSALPLFEAATSNEERFTYPGSLDTEEIETQMTNLTLTHAQRKQNTAPLITLSADLSWPMETKKLNDWDKAWLTAKDDNQKPLYTISLGVDLSPLFSGAGSRDRQLNENSARILEERKTAVLVNELNQTTLLKANLAALRTQTGQFKEAMIQTSELIANAETLALQGALTDIELQTYRLQLQKRESELADSEDQVWYLAWYLSRWIIDK